MHLRWSKQYFNVFNVKKGSLIVNVQKTSHCLPQHACNAFWVNSSVTLFDYACGSAPFGGPSGLLKTTTPLSQTEEGHTAQHESAQNGGKGPKLHRSFFSHLVKDNILCQ